jgi:hypothetical protein
MQEREGEARALDIIADLRNRDGDFIVPDSSSQLARDLAEVMITEAYSAYPNNPSAAGEAALQQAVNAVREHDKLVAEAAVEQFKNQLRGISNVRRDLPADQNGAHQTFPIPGGGDEMDLVRRYTGGGGLP